MKLKAEDFIELLRKSDTFLLSEAVAKIKNAKLIASYQEDKSVILQDPQTKKFYYAKYNVIEESVTFDSIERFDFKETNEKEELKESLEMIFSSDKHEEGINKIKSALGAIINEDSAPEYEIDTVIKNMLVDRSISFVKKPTLKVKNLARLRIALEGLKKSDSFGKILKEEEKIESNEYPVILDKINWENKKGIVYQSGTSKEEKAKIKAEGYTLKGFKKTQVLAKKYWKDNNFRKLAIRMLEGKTKPSVFCGYFKNLTLLSEEELSEMLTKTLLAVKESNNISDDLKKITEAIETNRSKMLNWGMLSEAPVEAPEQAIDVEGEAGLGDEAPMPGEEPAAEEIPMPGEPTDETEALGSEEDLATEASEEIKIINALLDVVEDVFWNGNQENNELANIIKEIRDMRVSGSFDENRLSEIFKDLFSITQQISTNVEEESEGGEGVPELPEEGTEGEESMELGEPPAEGSEGEPSPLESYM